MVPFEAVSQIHPRSSSRTQGNFYFPHIAFAPLRRDLLSLTGSISVLMGRLRDPGEECILPSLRLCHCRNLCFFR